MINSIKKTFNDKDFLKTAFALIFPIALQNLLMSGVNFLDNIMIGRLGEASIASVSLANQYFFVMNLVVFGACSGAGIFISQFHGKGDMISIRKVLLLNVIGGGVIAFAFMLIGLFFPEHIMRIFTADTDVIKLGVDYLLLSVICYIPTSVSMAFQIGLKSVGRTRIPLFMAFVALCLNGVFNYTFIFGNFGAPAMGVAGAALATTLSRIIEMVITVVLVRIYSPELMIKLVDFGNISKEFLKKFMHTVTPVVLNEAFWGLGTCLYSFVYGRMGTDTVAAVSIATTVEKLLNVFMLGMGNAAVVMIGSKIGEGNIEVGKAYSSKYSVLSWVMGCIMAVAIIIVTPIALTLFKVAPLVQYTASFVLADIALISILQFYNHTHIVGSLRGGGDTRFCLFLDLLGVWGLSLPLLIICGLILKWPIQYTYLSLGVDQLVKVVIITRRLKSGKWIKNLVKDM